MVTQKTVLENREHIMKIVDCFYAKVRKDELIGPIFNDEAKVNWDEHLPKLYNFWQDLLLGSENYHGRPFPPHLKFNLKIEHFERWLKLFIETVDENYTGLKADEMKSRALRIAQNFLHNINSLRNAQ
ncbi:MAG: group III truncated hemoglobin [Pseudobdellovibrio sp.]